MTAKKLIPLPQPGETLREDFLKWLGMSVGKLALELGVRGVRPRRVA